MRTIFIGDIHGCIDELRELIEQRIKPTKNDRVIILGDMINKWPGSIEVIRYIRARWFECIRGNHEYSYIRKHDQIPTYREYRTQLTNEEHAWILALPWALEEDGFIAVHAGLIPGKTISEHLSDPMMVRNLVDIRTIKRENGPVIPWHQEYHGTKKIIYGHWAAQGFLRTRNTIGLDTGCVYGKQLTAYILESDEIISMPAKRVYQTIE